MFGRLYELSSEVGISPILSRGFSPHRQPVLIALDMWTGAERAHSASETFVSPANGLVFISLMSFKKKIASIAERQTWP